MSKGKVNLLARIHFPRHRAEILDAMGYCGVCQKRMAVGRLNIPEKDGSQKEIIVCGECAKKMIPRPDQPGEKN
jgi:uncharacterized CHY-type Zn-finger protein